MDRPIHFLISYDWHLISGGRFPELRETPDYRNDFDLMAYLI